MKCAICCEEVPLKEITTPSSPSSSTGVLGTQLSVIFILRNIFEVKLSHLESFLLKWGDPENWLLKLCEKCDRNVTDIQRIFQRLHEITRELQRAKCILQERIRMSEKKITEKQEVNVDNIHEVVRECRRSYCRRKVTPFPPTITPFKEGDLQASEMAITLEREQILKQEVDTDAENLFAEVVEDIYPNWCLEVQQDNHMDDGSDDDLNDVSMAKNSDHSGNAYSTRTLSHQIRKENFAEPVLQAEADSKGNDSNVDFDVPSDISQGKPDSSNTDDDQEDDENYEADEVSSSSSSTSDSDHSEVMDTDTDGDDDLPKEPSLEVNFNDEMDDDNNIGGLSLSRRDLHKPSPSPIHKNRKKKKTPKSKPETKTDGTTEVKCTLCHKSFLHELSLSYHIAKYHERKQEKKCTECNEILIDLRTWGMHMRYTHNLDVRHPCPVEGCSIMLWSEDRVSEHVKRRHKNNPNPVRQMKHVCPKCGKKFWNADGIRIHRCQVKEWRCQWCPQEEFSNREEYLEHRKNKHSSKVYPSRSGGIRRPRGFPDPEKKLKCQKCGRMFRKEEELQRHDKRNRCQKNRCNWCRINFPSKEEYLQHRMTHKNKEPAKPKKKKKFSPSLTSSILPKYELDMSKVTLQEDKKGGSCNLCGREFNKFKDLKEHVRTVHDKNEVCHLCGKKSKSRDGLRGHLEKVHKIGDFQCDVKECTSTFLTEARLSRHKEMHHNNSAEKVKVEELCEVCGKKFPSLTQKKAHVANVHERKYERICAICSLRITTTHGYKLHMKQIHDLEPEDFVIPPPLNELPPEDREKLPKGKKLVFQQKEQCHLCGREFEVGRGLKQHMLKSHQKTELKCGVNACPKSYTSQSLLENHRKSVHQVTPYCCMYCGKEFGKRDSMRKHELNFHKTDSKPFKCEVAFCDKVFSKQGYLDKHLKRDHNINSSGIEEAGITKVEST